MARYQSVHDSVEFQIFTYGQGFHQSVHGSVELQIFTYGQGFHQSVHGSVKVKNSRYLPMARGFISLFMVVLKLRIPDIYLWPGVSSVCS